MNHKSHTSHLIPRTAYRFLLSAFCFLASILLSAQSINIENLPYIEMNGSAQVEVVPDRINMQIVLREYIDGRFKVTIAEQEMKMINMLKIAGIDMSKLNLANVNADYVTITKRNTEVITEKTYHLTVSTVQMLTSAFQVLNDLNIKDARIISVTHSKMDSLQQATRIEAIRDARDKAGSLLRSIGSKLGKPLIIRENSFFPFGGDMILVRRTGTPNAMEVAEDIMEDENVLEFRKIKIQSSIYARFAIE
ncbi:MAG: SIMPL domain-containing protein [Bacteroidetes bacterium]|nr:SIMPL domain-containing protein [Bacteroidota bacterium]MCL2303226.1 SIMPL domain-containing protein [Lentimicrobiaceae bacterium]